MATLNNSRKGELRPLPMRITQLQFDRLSDARTRDGMAMQEHVRRALDYYLDKIERENARRAETPAVAPDSSTLLPGMPVPPNPASVPTSGAPVLRSR